MAREFGKLYMTMWADRDFIALTPEAQRLYMFLISQPDLSRAGTLTMALRRWSRSAAGTTPDDITRHLAELSERQFVVVDEWEEEVLVRSYIRHDEGWKSPNIMKSIRGAAQSVISETLRAVIREELLRIDTSRLPAKINGSTGRSTRDVVEYLIKQAAETLEDCVKDPAIVAWNPSRNPSRNPSANPSHLEPFPEPFPEGSLTTTSTSTSTSTATATATSTPKSAPPAEPDGFRAFYDAYPRKMDPRAAIRAYTSARKRASERDILDGAIRFANDPNLPDKKYIPYPAKWLNGNGWENEPLPSQAPTRLGKPKPTEAEWWEQQLAAAAPEPPRKELTA